MSSFLKGIFMKARSAFAVVQKATTKHFSLLFVCVCLFFIHEGYSQTTQNVVRVKYISTDKVYIDGGKAAGITVGDPLLLKNVFTPIIGNSPVCFNVS